MPEWIRQGLALAGVLRTAAIDAQACFTCP
jgi:hypothetical protein